MVSADESAAGWNSLSSLNIHCVGYRSAFELAEVRNEVEQHVTRESEARNGVTGVDALTRQ